MATTPGIRTRRAPLEHVLPGRVLTRWIRWRDVARPAADRAMASARRAVHALAWWILGAAIVLAWAAALAWLDAGEARRNRSVAAAAAVDLRIENAELKATIEQMAASRTTPLFYLIEGGDTQVAAAKLQQLGILLTEQSYQMSRMKGK